MKLLLLIAALASALPAQVLGPAQRIKRLGGPPASGCASGLDTNKVGSDMVSVPTVAYICKQTSAGVFQWVDIGTASVTGLTSLGGLTAATQVFGTPGTTGTAPNWVSTGSTHTLHLPLAAAAGVTAGLVSKAEYDGWVTKAGSLTQLTTRLYSDLQSIPSTFAPSAHASSHQNGGGDEIATATPGANAIPKAGAGGTLGSGWIPDLSATYQPLDADLTALAGISGVQGDVIVRGASAWQRLAVASTEGHVLTRVSGVPAWAAPSGGSSDQSGATRYSVTAGSSTVYTAALTPSLGSYTPGLQIVVQWDETCGANPTINVDGLGARKIYKRNGASAVVQLAAGECIANQTNTLTYNSSLDTGTGGFETNIDAVADVVPGTGPISASKVANIVTINSSAIGTVEDEGSALTNRQTINFTGAGVTCSDVSSKSTCDIPGGGTVTERLFMSPAGCENTTPRANGYLNFDSTVAATIGCAADFSSVSFAASGTPTAYIKLQLHPSWTAGIDLSTYWYQNDGSGGATTVRFQYATACMGVGDSRTPSYNADQNVDVTSPASSDVITVSTQNTLTVTGCAPTEMLFIRVRRDNTVGSNYTGNARVTGFGFTQRHN